MTPSDAIYASNSFRLLAQGMKDREAYQIVLVLLMSYTSWLVFERWAGEMLEEQERKTDA